MSRTLPLLLVGLVTGYQLTPTTRASGRLAPVVMEYRLNNYLLDGPLTPLNNQVLVKLSKASDKTAGGLFVASAEVEKATEGTVVATGPGTTHPDTGKLLPIAVAVDDYVMLAEFTGEKIEYCGEQHVFVESDLILGVFEGGVTSASTFKPVRDRLLVEIAEQADETASGIVIAAQETEPPTQGQVVAVGAGKLSTDGELIPMPVASGESVLYTKATGTDLSLDGKKFKVVSAADCMAKW